MNGTQTKRVLIVDDESNVTMALAANLEKLGDEYIFETASNGGEALTMIQENQYDLVITDYMMPGMNGLDLAQAIRERFPDTHVVLMTAYGTAGLRGTVQNLQLDGYIDKPFSMEQIQELVKQVVGNGPNIPSILIMEDEPSLLNLYSRVLGRVGYEVYPAATMDEARQLLTERRFDVFLCDIHVGKDRGTDLIREQREALIQAGTQIIMASAEAQYRAMTKEMGIDFYLEKPIALGPLVTLVDRLTAHRQF